VISVSESGEGSHRLVEGENGTPLGYYFGAFFHPAISLEEKLGYELAISLSDYIETNSCNFESTGWQLQSKKHGITVEVGPSHLSLSGENPVGKAQEWYEHRYQELLLRFSEKFKPQIALGSKAMIRQLFRVDGDARNFLADHVMNTHPSRFDPLKRPLQLLGMRIAFPPYILEKTSPGGERTHETTDWSLELKAESWLDDPSKLFVEAEAIWQEPVAWDETTVDKLVGRLSKLTEYLARVRDFLNHQDDEQGDL